MTPRHYSGLGARVRWLPNLSCPLHPPCLCLQSKLMRSWALVCDVYFLEPQVGAAAAAAAAGAAAVTGPNPPPLSIPPDPTLRPLPNSHALFVSHCVFTLPAIACLLLAGVVTSEVPGHATAVCRAGATLPCPTSPCPPSALILLLAAASLFLPWAGCRPGGRMRPPRPLRSGCSA